MREEEEEKVEPPPSLHFPNSPFSASFSTSSAAAVAWASLLRAASISEREAEAAFCVFCLLSFCRGSNESATGKGFADELKKKKNTLPHLGLDELTHRLEGDAGPLPCLAELDEASRARASRHRGAARAQQWDDDGAGILVFVRRCASSSSSSSAAAAAFGVAEGIRHDSWSSSVRSGERGHFS